MDGIPADARLLDRADWKIERLDDEYVFIGAHELRGQRFWIKARLADLPNDLVVLDDLERFGIVRGINMPSVT